jgi:hypothetical protein
MRYLVITYILKPDGRSDEIVAVKEKLTGRINNTANIIMDFKEKTILKARMQEPIPREWDAIYYYFVNIYPDIFKALEDANPQEPK